MKLFRRNEFSIVIMESRLPELDAWHVCRQIRKSSDLPIVMISGRIDEEETLSFYDIGIDDFVYKPFSYKELMARLHVILRRIAGNAAYTPRRIIFDGLCIDTASRVVYKDGEPVSLTPANTACFIPAQNPNRALSREVILSAVWGEDFSAPTAPWTRTSNRCARASARITTSSKPSGVRVHVQDVSVPASKIKAFRIYERLFYLYVIMSLIYKPY